MSVPRRASRRNNTTTQREFFFGVGRSRASRSSDARHATIALLWYCCDAIKRPASRFASQQYNNKATIIIFCVGRPLARSPPNNATIQQRNTIFCLCCIVLLRRDDRERHNNTTQYVLLCCIVGTWANRRSWWLPCCNNTTIYKAIILLCCIVVIWLSCCHVGILVLSFNTKERAFEPLLSHSCTFATSLN